MMNAKFSRRLVLQSTALVAPVVLVGCGGSNNNPDAFSGSDARGSDSGPTTNPDIANLNALLSAEYGAIKAYQAGAGILMSPPAADAQRASAPTFLAVANEFLREHQDHAEVLAETITALGGTPVAESSVVFTPPVGFMAGTLNVVRLACNAEKAAAIAYNGVIQALTASNNRFIASAIEGDETQHFVILYSLLKGLAAPSATVMPGRLVPQSFVSNVGTRMGLQAYPDFTYSA